jgi:uncharacterized membrane protein YkvA (DUF1232 family)
MPGTNQPNQSEQRRMAEAQFRQSIQDIGEHEIVHAADLGQQTVRRFNGSAPQPLKSVWEDTKLLVGMLRDYVSGEYRRVPFKTITTVAAAVLYLAMPLDAIPDFVPGPGYVDDAAVIALCLKMVRADLDQYRQWKQHETHAVA